MTKNFRKFFGLCLSLTRDSTIVETFPNHPNPAQWLPEIDAKINVRTRQSCIKSSLTFKTSKISTNSCVEFTTTFGCLSTAMKIRPPRVRYTVFRKIINSGKAAPFFWIFFWIHFKHLKERFRLVLSIVGKFMLARIFFRSPSSGSSLSFLLNNFGIFRLCSQRTPRVLKYISCSRLEPQI